MKCQCLGEAVLTFVSSLAGRRSDYSQAQLGGTSRKLRAMECCAAFSRICNVVVRPCRPSAPYRSATCTTLGYEQRNLSVFLSLFYLNYSVFMRRVGIVVAPLRWHPIAHGAHRRGKRTMSQGTCPLFGRVAIAVALSAAGMNASPRCFSGHLLIVKRRLSALSVTCTRTVPVEFTLYSTGKWHSSKSRSSTTMNVSPAFAQDPTTRWGNAPRVSGAETGANAWYPASWTCSCIGVRLNEYSPCTTASPPRSIASLGRSSTGVDSPKPGSIIACAVGTTTDDRKSAGHVITILGPVTVLFYVAAEDEDAEVRSARNAIHLSALQFTHSTLPSARAAQTFRSVGGIYSRPRTRNTSRSSAGLKVPTTLVTALVVASHSTA